MSALHTALHDGAIVTRRNLIKMKRIPDIIVFALVQPVMFVLLFAYVFGSAIEVPGMSYREFLMAGIFVQTVAFGAANTCIGLADDLQKGIVERFRSLPMSSSAVLIGRTTADLVTNVGVVAILTGCGLLVGWRIRGGVLDTIAALGLLVLFAYTMSWISALVGLSVRSVEVAQSAGIIWIFPLSFVSNAFVPTLGMPRVLRIAAEWNPVTAVTTSMRSLLGNTNDAVAPLTSWPERNATVLAIGWCLLLLAVFIPLSVRRYRLATSR